MNSLYHRLKLKKPKYWWIVKLIWGVSFEDINAFTFGDTIYAPRPIPQHVIAHEKVHIGQQRHAPIKCFLLYAIFKEFRLAMEIPAFRAAVNNGMSKETAAKSLSSEFYGSLLTYDEALCVLSE